MNALSLIQPERAFLGGRIAHSYNEIEWHVKEFMDMFRVSIMLDADLRQYTDGFWMNITGRFRPSGTGLPGVNKLLINNCLRHLRTAGVTSAKKQDFVTHLSVLQACP